MATAVSATATAAVAATATDALDPHPPFNGLLAIDDSLVDANHGLNWYQGRTIGDCKFTQGAYHATVENHVGFLQGCTLATSDFSNFAYEIEVRILQGDVGGLLFRANFQKTQTYEFIVDTNGCYQFLVVTSPGSGKSLAQACKPDTISQGPNNNNLMAVIASGSTFQLYINRQLLTTIHDSTFNHGSIGVGAISLGSPTNAAFNNAKVWKMF